MKSLDNLIGDNTQNLIIIIDRNLEILYISGLGYSNDYRYHKSIIDYIYYDDIFKTINLLRDYIDFRNRKKVKELETRFKHNDGSVIWFSIELQSSDNSTITIPNNINTENTYILIGKDISREKTFEYTLKMTNTLLQRLNNYTEMKPLLNDFIDFVNTIINVESIGIRILHDKKIEFYSYIGYTKEFIELENQLTIDNNCICVNVIIGKTDSSLEYYTEYGSFYVNSTTIFISSTSKTGKVHYRNICSDFGYESVAAIPIKFSGKILGCLHLASSKEKAFSENTILLLENITKQLGAAIQRVYIAEKLKRSEKRCRLITENSSDLITLVTDKLNVEYLNVNSHRKKLGVVDITKKTLVDFDQIHPDDIIKAIRLTKKCFDTGKSIKDKIRIKHINGKYIWFEVVSRLVEDDNGERKILSIARDITSRIEEEKRRVEEEKRRRTEDKRINILKEEFFDDVSHEFRTPLTSIKGYTGILLKDVNISKETSIEYLSIIQRNAIKLEDLVNEILEYSRIKSGEYIFNETYFSPSKIISEVIDNLKYSIKRKNINISFNNLNEREIFLDKNQIFKVVKNLLSNAIKFSFKNNQIQIMSDINNAFWDFMIKDNGIGIEQEDISQIFKRFKKINKTHKINHGGIGIGLTICKKIIDHYKGKIWVESDGINKGTTFKFQIKI
jgi:PAS domain S-box-containing protein